MKIADMNWMQVEAYLQRDDRCLLPIGCTEQHAEEPAHGLFMAPARQ